MAKQLVDEKGDFKTITKKDLDLASENIAVVSIIGVQSTGKSTLLNKCFSTNFQVMDESRGMSQTTKGILIAKGPSYGGRKILLIDTEGSDSLERGRKVNDSFERESAAFVLNISNTVIINMECKSVGLQNGASRPLLKTVFQVMLDKSTSTPRKVNLMFVLRDKNMSPLSILEKQLKDGLKEIWQGIYKSEANGNARLQEYFNVVVMTMSHYVLQREEFDNEVEEVKNRLLSLVNDGQTYPASNFLDLAKRKWDDITKNMILKFNLNEPTAYKVFCQDIMWEKRENFLQDQKWLETEEAVQKCLKTEEAVKNGTMAKKFGKDVNSIMVKYLSQYDEKIPNICEGTKNDYMNKLTEILSQVVEGSYLVLVEKMREAILDEFANEIARVIEIRGKLENIKSDTFSDKFKGRLRDACVEHASWKDTRTSSEFEIIKSKLNSYKEGARDIIEWLKKQEQNNVTMLVNCIKLAGFGAAVGAAITAPPIAAVVGMAALGLGVAVPLPAIAVGSIIQALIKHVETKEHIGRERKARPEVDKIMKALESIKKKQENKDGK